MPPAGDPETVSSFPTFSVVLRGGDQADIQRLSRHSQGAEVISFPGFQEGLTAAAGDVVVFLRAECLPLPGWLHRFRAAFHDPRLAAAAGRVFPALEPESSDWARIVARENLGPFERFDFGHTGREVTLQESSFLPSDNFAVRQSTALQLDGFRQELPLLRILLEEGEPVHYLPGATVRRPFPADFPLERRFAAWWQDHGRRQVQLSGPHLGFARLKARWQAQRKSQHYRKRMNDWPLHSAPWTTLAAKCHLHRGRALELQA